MLDSAAGSLEAAPRVGGRPLAPSHTARSAPTRRAGQTTAEPVRMPLQYPQPTAPRSAATQTTGRGGGRFSSGLRFRISSSQVTSAVVQPAARTARTILRRSSAVRAKGRGRLFPDLVEAEAMGEQHVDSLRRIVEGARASSRFSRESVSPRS